MKTKIVAAKELQVGDAITFNKHLKKDIHTWVVVSVSIIDDGIILTVAPQPTGCLTSDIFIPQERSFNIIDKDTK
jgi:hypothetical protein